MASRQSRLEAERLAIIQKSISRGRSKSPNRSRSTSPDQDKLKWSIMKHDPSERLDKAGTNDDVNDEPSEEENISDDDDNEKFHYDDTGNILPNYACHDEKINEISEILENSNLNDNSTIKKLEQLTASERAFANAKTAGKSIDASLLKKLQDEKSTLPSLFSNNDLDLSKSEQDVEARKQKLEDYASYRKKIIDQENEKFKEKHNHSHIQGSGQGQGSGQNQNQPSSGSNTNQNSDTNAEHDEFNIPYTSAIEDKLDSEFASHLNETIIESEVDSNKSQSRIIQTITRGNFFQLIDPKIKPKMFLLCMDFSPESIFALEWALGTVLVDGAVLFIIYVIEENDSNHNIKANTATESTREQHRLNMLNKAKQQVLNLIKLTKLQIHIVIEIIHHPIPRHLILEIIDNLQPTLVIVGSKGQSAIKGVLLGSLSNYLVTKSSVPVMVVREKLKKINRFKNGSSVFSNNIKPLTLSEARID